MHGERELEEVVHFFDVGCELGQWEVEVDGPGGVDDLCDCFLHAVHGFGVEVEGGLVGGAS